MSVIDYRYRESRVGFFVRALKYRYFERFTSRASAVFLRGRDSISTQPWVNGEYEREIVTFLAAAAQAGCRRALIDIGANVGLTTYYAGEFFDVCHCFEPNPQVHLVLKANLFDRLGRSVFTHEFGLGASDSTAVLTVPKNNFGGAFIEDHDNSYTRQELAAKDGFKGYDRSNYHQVDVKIRRGRDVLRPLIEGLPAGGITIKIDVEGFENAVLEEVAASLPRDRAFAIVLENWSRSFDPAAVAAKFPRPARVYKLNTAIDPAWGLPRKLAALIARGREFYLDPTPADWVGTVVILEESVSR